MRPKKKPASMCVRVYRGLSHFACFDNVSASVCSVVPSSAITTAGTMASTEAMVVFSPPSAARSSRASLPRR